MTTAQLASRAQNADRRARDLRPSVLRLAADRWAVESARRDGLVYLIAASVDGIKCSCPAGDAAMPCYHTSAVLLAATAVTPQPPTPGALAA